MTLFDKPKRVVSQAALKEGCCYAGCGATVTYRTTPRVYCEPCGIERKRASAREAMEKQRRNRGVPKIKGTTIRCTGCRVEVVLDRNARTLFCRACYLASNGSDARERAKKKRSTVNGRQYHNAYARMRRATDPAWGVSSHIRTLIHRALGSKKAGRSWKSFVPYTLDELMQHLERQFTKGMTWDNRGKWHIDHITPLSSFNYESPDDPDFKAAWALSNLRPLWAKENLSKNAKRTHLL